MNTSRHTSHVLSFETRTHACGGKRFAVVHSFTERVNKQTKTSSVGVREKQEKKKDFISI